MTRRLTDHSVLTFDCYGTLIDWEAGILAALDPLLDPHGVVGRSDEELLERFARLESEAERGPFQRYRSILARVARGFGGEFGAIAVGITLLLVVPGVAVLRCELRPLAFAEAYQAEARSPGRP